MAMKNTKEVFNYIYEKNTWGSSESLSGPGSTLAVTHRIIDELPSILSYYKIHSFLDIPCGDFNWMKTLDLTGVDYIGGDIVNDLINKNKQYERDGVRFKQLDLLSSKLPSVDLIFVRDCLVHLPFVQIRSALRNIMRSDAKWLMTTTFPGHYLNHNISIGQWRPINLETAPFFLPSPKRYLFEDCPQSGNRYRDKSLGLWKIESIFI